MKNNIGIPDDVYTMMVDYYVVLSKDYNAKGIRGLMEERFQSISLKKIALFMKQMKQINLTLENDTRRN